MAETIYSVIKDEGFRKMLISKGFERVKKFTWQKTAEDILEIINSAVKTS